MTKLAALVLFACVGATAAVAGSGDWPVYGGDEGASHYAALGEITPANVSSLQEAWSYRVPWPAGKPFEFEATPLEIDGVLYICLPRNDIVALDAETGAVRWQAPALPVVAVDTTGAGDCFVGVLAAAMMRGLALPAATRRAAVAGSLACTIVGALPSFPGRASIEAALARGPQH